MKLYQLRPILESFGACSSSLRWIEYRKFRTAGELWNALLDGEADEDFSTHTGKLEDGPIRGRSTAWMSWLIFEIADELDFYSCQCPPRVAKEFFDKYAGSTAVWSRRDIRRHLPAEKIVVCLLYLAEKRGVLRTAGR